MFEGISKKEILGSLAGAVIIAAAGYFLSVGFLLLF